VAANQKTNSNPDLSGMGKGGYAERGVSRWRPKRKVERGANCQLAGSNNNRQVPKEESMLPRSIKAFKDNSKDGEERFQKMKKKGGIMDQSSIPIDSQEGSGGFGANAEDLQKKHESNKTTTQFSKALGEARTAELATGEATCQLASQPRGTGRGERPRGNVLTRGAGTWGGIRGEKLKRVVN